MAVFGWEETYGFEDVVEIFAFYVLLEVVYVVGTLEFFAHWDDEGTWDYFKGFSFIYGKSENIIFLNFLLIDSFEDELFFLVGEKIEWAELELSIIFEHGDDL